MKQLFLFSSSSSTRVAFYILCYFFLSKYIVIQNIQTQTLTHTQPYKSTDLTNLRVSYITVLSLLFYYMYKTNLRIKCHIHDS